MAIFQFMRAKILKEAYALLWLIFGGVFVFFSIWKEALDSIGLFFGIAYPPTFLFLVLIFSLIVILVQFSLVISFQRENLKRLTQEIALIKEQLERLTQSADKE